MKSQPEPKELQVPSVRFLGEQKGRPERLLKSRLIAAFEHNKDVQRAYLARISAGGQQGVSLCIKSTGGPDRSLVQQIGVIFATVFGAHEHLDVLFLSEVQEASLKNVCPAFFSLS